MRNVIEDARLVHIQATILLKVAKNLQWAYENGCNNTYYFLQNARSALLFVCLAEANHLQFYNNSRHI